MRNYLSSLYFCFVIKSLEAIKSKSMKKVFAILTAAVMLGTASFAQQSQTSKDTTTHKTSTTKKSGHSTTHKSKSDSTTKSTTKKP